MNHATTIARLKQLDPSQPDERLAGAIAEYLAGRPAVLAERCGLSYRALRHLVYIWWTPAARLAVLNDLLDEIGVPA